MASDECPKVPRHACPGVDPPGQLPCSGRMDREVGQNYRNVVRRLRHAAPNFTTTMSCRLSCVESLFRYPGHASHGRATKPVRRCDPLHTRPGEGRVRRPPARGNQRAVTAGLLDCAEQIHSGRKPSMAPVPRRPRERPMGRGPRGATAPGRSCPRDRTTLHDHPLIQWERSLRPTDPPPVDHHSTLTRSTANQCRLYAFSTDPARHHEPRGQRPLFGPVTIG